MQVPGPQSSFFYHYILSKKSFELIAITSVKDCGQNLSNSYLNQI